MNQNKSEINDLLGRWVEVRNVQGDVLYSGKVLAGSESPTVFIETQDGQKIYQQASMVTLAEEPTVKKPMSGLYFVDWVDGDHIRLTPIKERRDE